MPTSTIAGKPVNRPGKHLLGLLPSPEPYLACTVVSVDVGAHRVQAAVAGLAEEAHRRVAPVALHVELRQAKLALGAVPVGGRAERVWALLEQERAAPRGVHGRIPAFYAAEAAAARLAALPVWQAAWVIKAVPDQTQLPVRRGRSATASWST